jgi:hypothetical protein
MEKNIYDISCLDNIFNVTTQNEFISKRNYRILTFVEAAQNFQTKLIFSHQLIKISSHYLFDDKTFTFICRIHSKINRQLFTEFLN